MGSEIVAVLAVHNEEKIIPLMLKPLEDCVDLVVAIIDNCVDRSEWVIDILGSKTAKFYLGSHTWKNFRAETKRFGIDITKRMFPNAFLLMVDCDLIVDDYSVAKAKKILEATDKEAVVFIYKQYSLGGSVLDRLKDEIVNVFGKLTRIFTKQPVRTGIYMVKVGKAEIGDVTSDYESLLSKLKTVWIFTDFKHLRPRYDKKAQIVMGMSRSSLKTYNLLKVLAYSVLTVSPYVLCGYLQGKLSGKRLVAY